MTLESLLVGTVALLVGAGLTLAGFRFFLILLPLFCFVAGFYLGSAAVTAIFGDGFLSTLTGWLVGLIGGIALGLLSYLFFYLDVIILAGAVGASLGSGFMIAIGFSDGLLTVVVAAICAIALAVATLMFNVPKYLVILLTSLIGALTLIGGAMLIFGKIPLADLGQGAIVPLVRQAIKGDLLWSLIAIAVVVVGVVAQLRSTSQMYVLDATGSSVP